MDELEVEVPRGWLSLGEVPELPESDTRERTGRMKFLVDWLDSRTGCRKLFKETLFENVPGGSRWRYVWRCINLRLSRSIYHWPIPLDVIQPECSDGLGKRLLYPMRDVWGLVSSWPSSLHRSGDDGSSRPAFDAGCDRWRL